MLKSKEFSHAAASMLLFSDMSEELPDGVQRRLRDDEFREIRVAAVNVKRLHGDTANPTSYRSRLSDWKRRVTEAGAVEWRTFLDARKLPSYLEEVRG
jgi:hypothetical protein